MRRRRRNIGGDSVGSAGGQVLALSLFIMLLAFFIVLNAISNYEKGKTESVLNSLESAFSVERNEHEDYLPAVAARDDKSINEGDVLDRLQALFVAQIPSYNGKIDRNTGTMHVELSLDEFESAVMAIGRSAAEKDESESVQALKNFFLPALVALIKNDRTGKPYRVDILANTDDNPALLENSAPQKLKDLSIRIARIAARIENDGLPQRLMSVGVKKGKTGTVELFFRPHIPYDPRGESNG